MPAFTIGNMTVLTDKEFAVAVMAAALIVVGTLLAFHGFMDLYFRKDR